MFFRGKTSLQEAKAAIEEGSTAVEAQIEASTAELVAVNAAIDEAKSEEKFSSQSEVSLEFSRRRHAPMVRNGDFSHNCLADSKS